MHATPRTLIEAFLPFEGEVALAKVYDAASLVGMADQPIRLAIRRLIAAGEVRQEGRGRAGTLSLTEAGRRHLQRDRYSVALALAHDAGEAVWDQHWRLVAVSTPEADRRVRDGLRRDLIRLGAVAISTGLYVSPHDLVAALDPGSDPYLSTATTADLCVQGVKDPLLIAEMLWPQRPVRAAYRELDAALRHDAANTDAPTVRRMLELAHALEHAMRGDPLLPLELRSQPWPPSQIRRAWAQRWEELSGGDAPVYAGWLPVG